MTRHPLDFYRTDYHFVEALLKYVNIRGKILECAAGDGAIVDPLRQAGHNVTSVDIDPNHRCNFYLDMTDPEDWAKLPKYDWVITNPPFCEATKMVPLAWKNCNVGIAMLLRITWLEACQNRFDFWSETSQNLEKIITFKVRSSFTGDGSTDKTGLAWYVYRKDHWLGTQIIPVDNSQKEQKLLGGTREQLESQIY